MSAKPYALRIPKGLLELAELKSKADRTDKATALRQLLLWIDTAGEFGDPVPEPKGRRLYIGMS